MDEEEEEAAAAVAPTLEEEEEAEETSGFLTFFGLRAEEAGLEVAEVAVELSSSESESALLLLLSVELFFSFFFCASFLGLEDEEEGTLWTSCSVSSSEDSNILFKAFSPPPPLDLALLGGLSFGSAGFWILGCLL